MAIAGLLVLAALLIGCATVNVNVSSGTGTHELGPEDRNSFETSKDSQQSTDAINRVESKISGIDKSQNEISEQIDKSSQVQQQQLNRDEAIDKLNPRLKRDKRKALYKDKNE